MGGLSGLNAYKNGWATVWGRYSASFFGSIQYVHTEGSVQFDGLFELAKVSRRSEVGLKHVGQVLGVWDGCIPQSVSNWSLFFLTRDGVT